MGAVVGNTLVHLNPHTMRQTHSVQLPPRTELVAQLDFYLVVRTPSGYAAFDLERMRLDLLTREQYFSLKDV